MDDGDDGRMPDNWADLPEIKRLELAAIMMGDPARWTEWLDAYDARQRAKGEGVMDEELVDPKVWRKFVRSLPPEGEWWHKSGEDDFVEIAIRLDRAGVSPADIELILRKAFDAVAGEFGG